MNAMHAHNERPTQSISERVRNERAEQEQANRRRDPRFTVPGSLVRVPCRPFSIAGVELETRDMLFGLLPAFWTQRREVINMSKGGLAFESRWPMARGRKLRIQLWVSGGEEPLELIGETRWCKRLTGRLYHVGVQFDPFGREPGHNSPAVLEALRALEADHS
jgi:hypothetical protein